MERRDFPGGLTVASLDVAVEGLFAKFARGKTQRRLPLMQLVRVSG